MVTVRQHQRVSRKGKISNVREHQRKKVQIIQDSMGLWYALREGGFDWRRNPKNICLGYPKKEAYKKARELGLR